MGADYQQIDYLTRHRPGRKVDNRDKYSPVHSSQVPFPAYAGQGAHTRQIGLRRVLSPHKKRITKPDSGLRWEPGFFTEANYECAGNLYS